ncbi:ATP-binding protein [Streptomyces sp. NPDC051940]|uniref:ATP-binding protein n=1 Tax=Streptomyces sp. NPDC051940 TaxID=3155675 RepID=UPI003433407D
MLHLVGALAAGALLAVLPCWLTVRKRQHAVRAAELRAERAERLLHSAVAEVSHLAAARLPAAATARRHRHTGVPGLLHPEVFGGLPLEEALAAVLAASDAVVQAEAQRVDAAARAGLRGIGQKIQTLLIQIRAQVEELQTGIDDPRLLALDFRNELALARVQALAVLCGAWPGLVRTDSVLADVVAGAKSRVTGYSRVRIDNHLRQPGTAVVARAAEPVALALAELLGNATAYSHPQTAVHVSIEQGHSGALVVIDDMGVGMGEEQLRHARDLLAGNRQVLLTDLGDPPQAGFAVIGLLCRQYGFACHVEPSPYGGVRVLLRLPEALLTQVADSRTQSVLAPEPLGARNLRPAAAATLPAAETGGLPARRRRGAATVRHDHSAPDDGPTSVPESARSSWGALQSGSTAGRDAARAAHTDDTVPEGIDTRP